MMTDTTELGDLVKRLRDANTNHIDADLWMMEAADRINTLAAKLAEVTDDCDDLQIALASARKQLERYIGEAEAALPAVYRLGLDEGANVAASGTSRNDTYSKGRNDAATAIRALSTPTAAELMARIHTGEKE